MSFICDIRTIAAGEIYPDFPAIFPDAKTLEEPNSQKISLVLEASKVELLEDQESSCSKKPSRLTLGAALFVCGSLYLGTTMTLGIGALGALGWFLSSRKTSIIPPAPAHRVYEPIEYSKEDDDYVRENCKSPDHRLVEAIDMVFRNYRLGVIQKPSVLQDEIHQLVSQARASEGLVKGSILSRMDQLVASGEMARAKVAEEKERSVAIFIGQSGAGKTTLANYAHKCVMRRIEPEYLRRPSHHEGDYVVIAESGLGPIGHKLGLDSSETFNPQLFPIGKNLILCDCPGLSDNRAKEVALCNSLSIVEIIRNASKVQGFLFVISYPDALSVRATGLRDDLKAMQLLLKDFLPYQNSTLFLVTKAQPKATIENIRRTFLQILDTIVRDPSGDDPDLQQFCRQIQASGVLNRRIVICDPLDPSRRQSLVEKIQGLTPLDPAQMDVGRPLNPDVLRTLDLLREEIRLEMVSILQRFKAAFIRDWKKRIGEELTAQQAKELFDVLGEMKNTSITLEELIENPIYQIPIETIQKIKSALINWEKVSEFVPDREKKLSASIHQDLQSIETAINSLQVDAFISFVKTILQSYPIQKNVNERSQFMGERRQYDDEEGRKIICQKVSQFLEGAESENLYGPNLASVLNTCDALQIRTLSDCMHTNLSHPFAINILDRSIKVQSLAENISLSQVFDKIQKDLPSAKEVEISNFTTLYFDKDLKGKPYAGKTIQISGKEIEITKRCEINLHISPWATGQLFIRGCFSRGGEVAQKEDAFTDNLVFDTDGREAAPKLIQRSW